MYDLTDEQRNFLNAEGKVALCACPGSGKTFIVANKLIQYISKWKYSHQGVAVLSFTNVASKEIEIQSNKLFGSKGNVNYPHYIGTVDSFINTFIVLRFGHLYNKSNLKPQIALNNLWNIPYKFWRTECYKNNCIDNIGEFHYGIDGEFYRNKNKISCIPNKGRLIPPCQQYKNILYQKGIIFQSEVSAFAYRMLKGSSNIAAAIAKRFPVLIVDEVQDTSEEQMAVLDLLIDAGMESVFLVGDPDQSIYEWRSATPQCFENKIKDDKWTTLYFKGNFRSSQKICDVTKHFSATIADKEPNVAIGINAKELQKPILLLYPPQINSQQIYEFYLEKCKQMNIPLLPENIAILSRGSIHNETDIDKLWKSSEIEMFAQSAYEWSYGSRKKAFTLCEQAVFSMLVNDISHTNSFYDDIEAIYQYDIWKSYIIDILTQIPSIELPIDVWVQEFKKVLQNKLVAIGIVERVGKEISTIIKIKTRDTKNKDFKKIAVKNFFERRTSELYTRSSVHGVKGETFDAVLFHVQSQRGNTITPSFLNNGSLDHELMRIAYVAMTRPRKLLVVALPKSQKPVQYVRFPTEKWEYVNISP